MTKVTLKFKIVLLSFGFYIASTAITKAQSHLTIDASQVYTNFQFQDSKSTKDKDYKGIYSGSYSIGYRFESEKGFLVQPRIGMRKAGATLVYDNSNYSWDMRYADIKIGIGYILKKERFSPYLMVSPYYAMLLTANQVLDNKNFDIKASKGIQNSDYGIFITPGVKFKASDVVSAYAEFNYMMGIQNIETDTKEKATNTAYSLSIGLAFTITKKASK